MRLELDRDFFQFANSQDVRNVRYFQAFKEPIPSFAPKEKILYDLSQGFNLDQIKDGVNLTPSVFAVALEYQYDGKIFKQSQTFDLKSYFGTFADRKFKDHAENISNHLKKISEKISR